MDRFLAHLGQMDHLWANLVGMDRFLANFVEMDHLWANLVEMDLFELTLLKWIIYELI